ncbi:helix-turn-helix domain-containing protein [Paludisphaera rhizosphaerae]|uniref:helix-turn-helix domain-containing protein n=1 Tax=Paludisphaera rhizosphaerae TaxID=2711216 RepID=UPI0013EA7AD6|nr:helix-turn-helix domain-containing protein [Paludisphaera rhizosphaerae]
MKRNPKGSPVWDDVIAGMDSLIEALNTDEPLEKRFTVRTVKLDVDPHAYSPADVKAVRTKLGASQPLLAKFLGVSLQTLRSWEQGQRPVPTMAARYLDDLQEFPELWTRRIQIVKK